MKEFQLERIVKMENLYNEVSRGLQDLEVALDKWSEKMPMYDVLLKYYMGEEWREDEEASNQEGFPSPEELSHGILAEDTIFNDMTLHHELSIRLLKIATKMLEQ